MLTASGVLQRCLPELDDALVRRRPSALELDPLATLRLERLARVHELLSDGTDPPYANAVLLAALALDAADDDAAQGVVVARRTVQRLDLGARVEQTVAALVADAEMLTSAARRSDSLSEESVLQIAVHLGSIEQADALYLLSRAIDGSGHGEDAKRMAVLHEMILGALAYPELVGREAGNEVEARRIEAAQFVTARASRERIRTAPRAYVLAHAPEDLARQAGMCDPPLGRHDARVEVEEVGEWFRVEITARDRVGLLARARRACCSTPTARSIRHRRRPGRTGPRSPRTG